MMTFMEYVQLIESDEPSRRDFLARMGALGSTALTGGGLAYFANSLVNKKKGVPPATTSREEAPQTTTTPPEDSGSVTKPGGEKGQGKGYGRPDKVTARHAIEAKGELLAALSESRKTPARFRSQISDYMNKVHDEQREQWKSVGFVRGQFVDQEWLGPKNKKYTKKQWEKNDYEENIVIMCTRAAEMMIEDYSGRKSRFDDSGAYKWVEEVLWPAVQASDIDVWPIIGLADKRMNPPGRVK